MAYTVTNYKTKASLKRAVQWYKHCDNDPKHAVKCFQPGIGPSLATFDGTIYLEGPHSPAPHTWYAKATLKDGNVVRVS